MKGKSKKAFSFNVSELVNSYNKTGKIGTSSPESIAKARKQALAVAFSKKKG
jgi:hypothetical protein